MSVEKKGFGEISEDVLKNLAERTPGLSIAILQNVVDLAFRNARKEDRLPDGHDLQNALEEYNYGEKREWNEAYYRSVAIHESGHAYLAYLSGEKPSYMTIESRGNFGGYMSHENGEDKPNYTKEDLIWRIRCALGGRAAEEVFYGKEAALNTGASSDLQSATKYALNMICNYGMMDGQLLAIPFETIAGTPLAADYLARVNQLLQREMQTTIQLLTEGKERVQRLAEQLLANNHLTGDEIQEVLAENGRK
jgi:ATP-dependent Zn protease